MKSRENYFFAFVGIVLPLLLSLQLQKGVSQGLAARGTDLVVATEEEALDALWSLQDDQTLRLEVTEVRLNDSVEIAASNVAIRGTHARTFVHCSRRKSAFKIWGTNVTLTGLEISDCKGAPAVRINGMGGESNDTEVADTGRTNSTEEKTNAVYIEDCVFQRNNAKQGAAVFAKQSKLTIQNSSFVDNHGAQKKLRSYGGGAVLLNGGEVAIYASEFLQTDNRRPNGGAIRAMFCGKVVVESSTFKGNYPNDDIGQRAWGGGLFVDRCKTVNVSNSLFENNRAGSAGGGFCAMECDVATVTKSQFKDNRVSGNIGLMGEELGFGGGVSTVDGGRLFVEDSQFEENWAHLGGGGVSVLGTTEVTITESQFRDNAAGERGGGLQANESARVEVSDSSFFNGTAGHFGGAIYVSEVEQATVSSSTFEQNSASTGGAVNGRLSELRINSSMFVNNSATNAGGAVGLPERARLRLNNTSLKNNRAFFGGAIFLDGFSSVLKCKLCLTTLLQGNVAFRGGGIFCQTSRVDIDGSLRFVKNIATESGGGIYAGEAAVSEINEAWFRGNVASFGGGMSMKDSPLISLTFCIFVKNIAIEGGALHVSLQHGAQATYKIPWIAAENNSALNPRQMKHHSKKQAVFRWLKERERVLSAGGQDWLKRKKYLQGRGGGIFLGLSNNRKDSSLSLDLTNMSLERNVAKIGGAVYIENDHRPDRYRKNCPAIGLSRRPCLSVDMKNIHLVRNKASVAGGGLFARVLTKEGSGGLTVKTLPQLPGCPRGHAATCYRRNRLVSKDGVGYGPQIATGAASLELLNVDGPLTGLTAGSKLTVPRKDGGADWRRREYIKLVAKDAFGQRITGETADSVLTVELRSKWIKEKRRYRAVNGVVTITDTYVAGYGVSDTLVIVTADERGISASLTFSTLPCPDGQLKTNSSLECFRCEARSYTFNATDAGCRRCEQHAVCAGTTMLAPEDGYWHSTPFSPFIRRCPVKKACSFRNRQKHLRQYYNDSDITKKLDCFTGSNETAISTCFEEYKQCETGYEGVLCGACSKGYGHSAKGECRECLYSLPVARALAALSAFVLFVVLTIKVVLGADSVRKRIARYLEDERQAVRGVLLRGRENSSTCTREEDQKDGSTKSASSSLAAGAQAKPETSKTSAGEGPSAVGNGEKPPFERCREHVEDPLSGGSLADPILASAALSAASETLVATFNILFNYIQLSTVALTLDVDWRSALNTLFAVSSALGRTTQVEFLPLDCSFSDRGDDNGVPNSLAVLWYQFGFPLVAMASYLVTVAIVKIARRKKRQSKYSVDPLPSMSLICFIVYLAYCMDLVANLLRVMNCEDLSTDYSDTHPHAKFEHMDLEIVWLEDTSVTCWRREHLTSAVFAALGLLLCLSIVVFMVFILYGGYKKNKLKDPAFIRRFGVLFLGYRPEGIALHWETVITARRMLLASIEVYAKNRETSGVQVGLLAIVIFIALALHDIVQPFRELEGMNFPAYVGSEVRFILPSSWRRRWADFNRSVTMNGLEGASLFMSLSFFLVAACISDDKASETETGILLAVCFSFNAVYFLFMLYRLWYELHHYLDTIADDANVSFTKAFDQEKDRETYLVVKVWQFVRFKLKESVDNSLNIEVI